MRYLFGDSTPFPYPFDFLSTLEIFMKAGTHVVMLEHGARRAGEEALAAQEERARGLEALEAFHQTVLRAVGEGGTPGHAYAAEYAQQIVDHAANLVSERKRGVGAEDERGARQAQGERARADEEIATHLRTFFQTARLPTSETVLRTSLVDGRPEAGAFFGHPGGLGVTVTLDTAKAPAWRAPRRLFDLLAGHVDLVVGIKKSWIGNKVTREAVRLDDWVIGSAELRESRATIAVRRKPDHKDTVVFELRRHGGGLLTAEVEHPGDPNASQVPTTAEASDMPHIERLWTALGASFDEILEERAAVTRISLDGEDPLARSRGHDVVERIVSILAPTALEVAQRSPNARELSLKRERPDGRREELYLKRADLDAALQPLPREGRAIFAPLGLADWVPAATVAPPPVALAEGRDLLTSRDFEEG